MQDMSPDMEDLMRKASEAYPLKETDDRWDEIASKITAPIPPRELKKDSGLKKYFASILLLLLFLFLGFFFFNKTGVGELSKQVGLPTDRIKQDVTPEENSNLKETKPLSINNRKSPVQKKAEENNWQAGTENELSITKQKAIDHNNVIERNSNTGERIDDNPASIFNHNEPLTTPKKQNVAINKLALPFNYPDFSLYPKTFFFDPNKSILSPKKKKGGFYNKEFYYGVVAGPGFNAIKNQEFKKAGWNIGLLGGYFFSRRFSVETGLLFSQKYYTTIGDHFSMKEIGPAMPSAMKIMAVDGYSKMIEIPVLLRYDFIQSHKRQFFSSAGFSSYILTKEDNQYHTSMNGTEEMMYGTYKTNKQYFAASLDLGVGYAQNFGSNHKIRFQPYLQIPLKGVGVGDLEITGAGLRVALTRQGH